MLSALKFVSGAVAKKDYAPTLTHFRIEGGRIRGYNGQLALCSPIALDLEVTPKAVPFVRAVEACSETISMHLTPNKRLSIKSGAFKAFIDCTEAPFPTIEPEGQQVTVPGEFLSAMATLLPFIAEDASRPWARGILFHGPAAYATNNIVIIEHWLGFAFPVTINVPKAAVVELLRIGEEPRSIQVTNSSVTFHYDENRWLRTQTYDLFWPDVMRILDSPSQPQPVPDGFFSALENLTHFVDENERVFFALDGMSTSAIDGEGAAVAIDPFGAVGTFNLSQLKKLCGVATSIDFSTSPARFFGDNLRGAIIGMRE